MVSNLIFQLSDPTDDANWTNQHAWMTDMLARFDRAFRPRVKDLDASEWKDLAAENAAE